MSEAQPSKKEVWLVFSGLLLALVLAALDQNIVATALPIIVTDLGGLEHLSWVVTAFMLTSTTTTPLYGKLSDLFGRRPLFVVSITLFLVGSALCGLAHSMLQLILFRGLQGLGAGGLMTLAQTTIADLIPPRERGRYQGLFGAVFAGCSVAGPLLGGFLTDQLSWRWIFYVNIPIGALALVLILVGLKPRARRGHPNIDYKGALLLTAGTSCLLLALSWGGTVYAWNSSVIGLLGSLVVVFYLLLSWQEHRSREPILSPCLFHNRIFLVGVSVIFLTGTALFSALVFMPMFFQLVLGQTPTRSGLLMAPMMAGVIISSVVSGRLVSHFGRYKAITLGGLATASLSFGYLFWTAHQRAPIAEMEVGIVLMGLSLGMVMPNLTVAIQNAVERENIGAATSASGFFRALGGSLGAAVAGALLNFGVQRSLGDVDPDQVRELIGHASTEAATVAGSHAAQLVEAYRQAVAYNFLLGLVLSVVALLLLMRLEERPLRSSH